jgi:uncharacterized membrane protein YeaQ/YmgE (transglycosylase-associated protein family)
MYAVDAGSDPEVVRAALTLLQTCAVVVLAGWIAERALDTGIRVRGLFVFCGAAGLYAGAWLWAAVGWPNGPVVGGQAIVPAFAGALAVAAVFKLINLGTTGSRR